MNEPTLSARAADGAHELVPREPRASIGAQGHVSFEPRASGSERGVSEPPSRELRAGVRAEQSGSSPGGGRVGRLVCVGAAVLGIGYASVCIAGRLGSPWPLEWMEGASVLHAQRLLHGLPLYAAARVDFIPFVYPPLSYLPMGLGLMFSGGALWGARLASVLAIVLCCGALWRAGKHVSAAPGAGLLAVGLFAMGYGYTGGFIDLARVDAWFVALSLCGVARLCAGRHGQGLLLLALACLAKQHAVLLLAAASGGVWIMRGRASLWGIACSWLGLGLCCAGLYTLSDGWIWTYCVTVPARHGLSPRLLFSFVLVDLCLYLPVVIGLCVYSVSARRDPLSRLLHWLLAAAVAASALGRAHPGGDDNVRLPAYALCVLVAAISFCELLATRPRWRWPLTAALVGQLAILYQPPALYWPTQQTAQRFEQLRAELVRCAGSNDFAAMDHTGLGAHPFVHTLALSDLRMNHDALAEQASDAVLAGLGATRDDVGSATPASAGEESGRPAQGGERADTDQAPRALAISSSFPALMRVLAEHYALCAHTPELPMPTGYALPATFIYKRKSR